MNPTDLCAVCKKTAACKQCYCTDPWLRLCEDCGRTHAKEPGSHLLFSYPLTKGKSAPPPMCAMCEMQPATVNIESTRVCADCASLVQSSVEKEAPPNPNIDMETMNAYLIAGLEGFKAAISDAGEVYNRLIQAVYSEKVRVIRELTQQASDMEQKISVFMQTVDPETNIAQVCQKSDWSESDLAEELKLLHWQMEMDEFFMRLPSAFTFSANEWLFTKNEVIRPISVSLYPLFWRGRYFSLPECAESRIPSGDISLFKEFTAWSFFSDVAVFACGMKKSPIAYVIELQEFQAYPTVPALFRCTFPGVICNGDHVFLFGGVYRGCPLTLCERYSVTANAWTALPCMQFARSHCYPVAQGLEFFVIGGKGTTTAEALHMRKLTFRTLSLELPADNMSSGVVFDGDIFIFLNGYVNIWERSMGAEYVTEVVNAVKEVAYQHNFGPPVRVGDEVFVCAFNFKDGRESLYCFDLGRKQLTERVILAGPNS